MHDTHNREETWHKKGETKGKVEEEGAVVVIHRLLESMGGGPITLSMLHHDDDVYEIEPLHQKNL